MKQRLLLGVILIFIFVFNGLHAQSWIVKDSILVFPEGFSSWLKRHNGGIDSAAPGMGNYNGKIGNIGTNQGVNFFDFNKDGRPDLTFQLFPSNNITREYLKGIFIQNTNGKFVLDTNFVIKAKGDMWLGGFGDFNGDGLNDYYYIIQNYHGADSNRIYSPEMIYDHWPEKVFLNNGKSFDTLTLDVDNLTIESTYVADIDNDGADEIIATDRGPDYVTVYKFDKAKKKFYKTNSDLSIAWRKRFEQGVSRYPLFNVANENNQNGFSVILFDSSYSKYINEPDWQPYNFKSFTYAKYNFNTKKLETYNLNRDSIFIPVKYSNQDADDYYRFSIHEKITAYRMDVDKNGEDEIVVGGYYQNNYYPNKPNRFAYGWKVLGLNGKDLTTQFFKDSGFDNNTEVFAHGFDIDETADGIEMIPGSWGNRGKGELGNYYKLVKGKFEKNYIRNIRLESGTKIDSTYFKRIELLKFPNYNKNKNALLLYDFDNIHRTSILYQSTCVDVARPTFEKNSYTICGSDSTLVKLTNFSKTDSTIWYVKSSVKISNVDQYVFKTEDSFYVKKIDSNGCVKFSDTIQINKYNLPSTPTISRDTANYLVSSSTTQNSWYKDGVILSDSTQKIKPTTPGNYTVKTTENGCLSAASNAYYFLITDIVRLSNQEYIKLAPNPFQNKLNFDFFLKGYQRLNIEVFELATGAKVSTIQNLSPGAQVNLGHLSNGTYIVKVSSADNKINYQFKMVKI